MAGDGDGRVPGGDRPTELVLRLRRADDGSGGDGAPPPPFIGPRSQEYYVRADYDMGYGVASSRTTAAGGSGDQQGDGAAAAPGRCGMKNLGNMCYINSAVQALLAVPPLRNWLASDVYKAEVRRDRHGVLLAFAALVKELCADGTDAADASKLKEAVGAFAPAFSGNEQQDAHEFATLLLDELHEAVNCAAPGSSVLVDYTRPDDEVALQEWQRFSSTSLSAITDWFYAQEKSTLVCSECDTTKKVWSAFNMLSVPVPCSDYLKDIHVVFVPDDAKLPWRRLVVKVDTEVDAAPPIHRHVALVDRVLYAVAKAAGVRKDRLVLCTFNSCDGEAAFVSLDSLDADQPTQMDVTAYMGDLEPQPQPQPATVAYGPATADGSAPASAVRSTEFLLAWHVPHVDAGRQPITVLATQSVQSTDTRPVVKIGAPIPLRLAASDATEANITRLLERRAIEMLYVRPAPAGTEPPPGPPFSLLVHAAHTLPSVAPSPSALNTQLSSSSHSLTESAEADPDPAVVGLTAVEREAHTPPETEAETVETTMDTGDAPAPWPPTAGSPPDWDDLIASAGVDARLPLFTGDRDPIVALDMAWSWPHYDSLCDPAPDAWLRNVHSVGAPADASASASGWHRNKRIMSLDDCMDLYASLERTDGVTVDCDRCGTKRAMTKRTALCRLPQFAIVHLKRFQFNAATKCTKKLTGGVDFPLTGWNLSPYLCDVQPDGGGPELYDLIATVNHTGSVSFGHYTATAWHEESGSWLRLNDKCVTRVAPADVARLQSDAYMLVYGRRGDEPVASAASAARPQPADPNVEMEASD